VATPTNVVWRKNVRAADAQIYLECQELTAWRRAKPATNVAANADAPPRIEGTETNRNRIESIVAEHDVLIITPEIQVMGDRAMYTASNDVLRVSGVLVIVADAHGSTLCTNFVFDRTANVITIEGPQATVLRESSFSSTNAVRRATNAPPRRKP